MTVSRDGSHEPQGLGIVGTLRQRFRAIAVAFGIAGGLVSGFSFSDKFADLSNKAIELFWYCDGRPVSDIRGEIRHHLDSARMAYSTVRADANALLKCLKEDPGALEALGAVEFYSGNYAEAERYFRRGLKSTPKHRGLRIDLADALVERGQHEAALIELRALDEDTLAITYRIARAHLLAGHFAEARHLLATVPSDFDEEAKRGKARILEAAALVGLARQVDGPASDQLMVEARQIFLEGMNKERLWWIEVLKGRSFNRYEPFTKVAAILGNKVVTEWTA